MKKIIIFSLSLMMCLSFSLVKVSATTLEDLSDVPTITEGSDITLEFASNTVWCKYVSNGTPQVFTFTNNLYGDMYFYTPEGVETNKYMQYLYFSTKEYVYIPKGTYYVKIVGYGIGTGQSVQLHSKKHTSHNLCYELYFGSGSSDATWVDYAMPYACVLCKDCDMDIALDGYKNAYSVSASTSTYTYDGKEHKPSVTVKVCGYTLKQGRDYTLSYSSGRTNVGTYTITVKPITDYFYIYKKGLYDKSATLTIKYKIVPKKTSITSLTAGSKKFTVKWTQITSQVSGYQIQYSTTSGFTSDNHTRTITNWKQTSTTFSNMKAKKKYYVRARVYKTVSNVKYYGSYCSKKYVTTKA